MGLTDRLVTALLGPLPTRAATPRPTRSRPGQFAGGRATVDRNDWLAANAGLFTVAPPPDWQRQWTATRLDTSKLLDLDPADLAQVLTDLSPDVSRAFWDFLRLCNPGWEITALVIGSEDTPSPQGQAVIDGILAMLTDHYGSPDVVWNRVYTNAFLRGMMLLELVLDPGGRTVVDLAVPDAGLLRFRRQLDPVRGPIWERGQVVDGNFVPLDRPTIRHIAVDPFPDSPYGRPLAAPALFATLFSLGMMIDLRRVIAQQGWPRIDLSLDLEALKAMMPPAAAADPDEFARWSEAMFREISAVYAKLQPDDAYVHSSLITVNRPVGTVDASSLMAVDNIIDVLDKQAVRALKTMPLLMGITDGVSEANANRQWEIHMAGIKSLQHLAETLIGSLLTLACEAAGVPATVTLRFSEVRAAERQRDAQSEALEIANAAAKRDQGWWSQEEASLAIVGHPPVAEVPPQQALAQAQAEAEMAALAAGAAQANPEPGSARTRLVPADTDRTLGPPPEPVVVDDALLDAAVARWRSIMPSRYDDLLDAEVA